MIGLAVALGGCAGSEPPPTPADSGHTAAPAAVTTCAVDPENALRVVCEVVREAAGPLTLTLSDADGEVLTFSGDPAASSQRLVGWGLHDAGPWAWAVDDGSGRRSEGVVVAGERPPSARVAWVTVTPGPTSVSRVVVPAGCGGPPALVMLDERGRVRWYQEVGGLGGIGGFDVTDRGSVLWIEQRGRVHEVGFDGAPRGSWSLADGELPRLVHHAAIGRGGRTLVLDATSRQLSDGLTYVVDGFTEITDGVAASAWDLLEVVDPVGLPSPGGLSYWVPQMAQAVDWAHENGLDLAPDGDPVLTFKHLDTVARVEWDPASPDHRRVRWAVIGDDRGVVFGDRALTLGSSAGLDPSFQYPHHPWLAPDGDLLLVDTGRPGDGTRVLRIRIDEGAGTADVIGAWPLDAVCPVHSSVYELPDGTLLAACASSRELFELDAVGIRKRSRLVCEDGDDSDVLLTRAQPLPP